MMSVKTEMAIQDQGKIVIVGGPQPNTIHLGMEATTIDCAIQFNLTTEQALQLVANLNNVVGLQRRRDS